MIADPGLPAPHASPAPLLEARHLVKRYGSRTVVDDVTLIVAVGEVVGIISIYTAVYSDSD